jgi:hypothetical protein
MNSDVTSKNAKLIAVCFSLLLLLQNCKSYYANAVSLDDAVEKGKSSTIIYNKDRSTTMDFDKVIKIDSAYYGMEKAKRERIKTPLYFEEGDDIYKNPNTFGLLLGALVMIGLIYGIEKLGLGDLVFPEDED